METELMDYYNRIICMGWIFYNGRDHGR